MIHSIIKRDGRVVLYEQSKIAAAILKALEASGEGDASDAARVANDVQRELENRFSSQSPNIEAIQDAVERQLMNHGFSSAAKAYILYRRQREKLRNLKSTILDYKDLVNSYVNVTDWRVKENSTVTYSVGGLILSNSGAITANYWLSEIYDEIYKFGPLKYEIETFDENGKIKLDPLYFTKDAQLDALSFMIEED